MISKKKAYNIIADHIDGDNVNIKKIVSALKNSKYGYESTIKKIVHTNKYKKKKWQRIIFI